MTKSLTKQYYDQTLEDGFYYAIYKKDKTFKDVFILEWREWGEQYQDCKIICKVPSYEEYQDLIQQNVNQESAIEAYIERIYELENQVKMVELKGKVK